MIYIDVSCDWDGIWDRINNLGLIENGLTHMEFELTKDKPSCFRIAREAHLILYRSMIEALKGTSKHAITYENKRDKTSNKNRSHMYRVGEGPWHEIHKIKVRNCRRAWRYSCPNQCKAPEIPRTINNHRLHLPGGWLINFYEALAKIQVKAFMGE